MGRGKVLNLEDDPRKQYVYGPLSPPKRRKVWPWVLLGVVVAPLVLFVGCALVVIGAGVSE
jgi:hypothetical protein